MDDLTLRVRRPVRRGGPARLLFALLISLCVSTAVAAAPVGPPMTYLYHPGESALDVRYLYQWQILTTALEKTKKKWGPYRIAAAQERMPEQRQVFELEQATGKLTVIYLSTTRDLEEHLVPVRIPVDKDLGGYCVFMIRRGEQKRFAGLSTLAALKQFRYGLGLGWVDVSILRASGFRVVTGSSYDGLFEMLVNGRFDVFLRGAVEVLDEYESRKKALPDLMIEEKLILYYPLPMYFWFSPTAEGRRLAARAEEGMRMMIADGSYDRVFDKYQRSKIERLRLNERRIFRIPNPNAGPETPFADKRLWFDPKTYRASTPHE